jgi:hypothetical protein
MQHIIDSMKITHKSNDDGWMYIGTSEHQNIRTSEHQNIRTSEQQNIRTAEHQNIRTSGHQETGSE